MLLNFEKIYKKYEMLNIRGIIHIGAHYGEEHKIYEKYNHIKKYIYFEPLSNNFSVLKENLKDKNNVILERKALGNSNGMIEMNVESNNDGQSSSILEPVLHLKQYPHIVFDKKETVEMIKLSEYKFNRSEYNFINIDVQGYELEVFKGAGDILNDIDYIISEVNRAEVYRNCPHVTELDEYLSKYEFKRVETTWDGNTWGDALYIKKNG